MEEKQCKGLIIQNNPFSTKTGNGKTIASMFSKWNKENLAQIYVSNRNLIMIFVRNIIKYQIEKY